MPILPYGFMSWMLVFLWTCITNLWHQICEIPRAMYCAWIELNVRFISLSHVRYQMSQLTTVQYSCTLHVNILGNCIRCWHDCSLQTALWLWWMGSIAPSLQSEYPKAFLFFCKLILQLFYNVWVVLCTYCSQCMSRLHRSVY